MTDEKKKMTAQDSSVGADDGQSISTNSKFTIPDPEEKSNSPERDLEELYRKMRRMSDPAYLHTVTLEELMDNVFEGKSAVIENLLYTGVYILAGAPKIGKSFLVAQIAHHVSTGRDLWGYKVHQGTVLYLALEDDESRLQRRMFRMFGVEGTSSLHFATNAKMIGGGLDEQLEKFVREHSDTKLIIVDTLQKVRESVSDSYSYSSDYEVIGKLKQFADRYGVCVLIVHHTRKQPAGDSFEMISGTTGLLGCADGALLMQKEKRTDSKATLEVVGRDQPDQRLLAALKEYMSLLDVESNYKKAIKQAEADLDTKLEKKYPQLTLEEIRHLLVEEKWFAAIYSGIDAIHEAVSHHLSARVTQLVERYEYTLKECEDEVNQYEAKVKSHLERMGFVW